MLLILIRRFERLPTYYDILCTINNCYIPITKYEVQFKIITYKFKIKNSKMV